MTKRDTFARVELDSAGSLVVRCGEVDHVFWDSDKGYLQRAAELINAAHDKAVREAVEEFRRLAVNVVPALFYDSDPSPEVKSAVEKIVWRLMSLPTEPEGK